MSQQRCLESARRAFKRPALVRHIAAAVELARLWMTPLAPALLIAALLLVFDGPASVVAAAEVCDPDDVDCLLRHDSRSVRLKRVRPNEPALLECGGGGNVSTSTASKLQWWVARRSALLASQDGAATVIRDNSTFALNANGSLYVQSVTKDHVEEYECVLFNGKNSQSHFVLLRHDYSYFYDGPLFATVFWGSCVTALIFCLASCVLNVLWVLIRKASLWWINRSERLSRVRNMVEAMEKYRHQRMETIHENYRKKVTAMRDNYHQQVDDLRSSYAKQADRFRDYRQARMNNVTQQIDNIRDNYDQQLVRIREYGSSRADRLVESYERQVNRIRTFTLQHRLKLMRQYKVEQGHINRLLDNIAAANNLQSIQEGEETIREMLKFVDSKVGESELERSGSFYSLPDLTNVEAYTRATPLSPTSRDSRVPAAAAGTAHTRHNILASGDASRAAAHKSRSATATTATTSPPSAERAEPQHDDNDADAEAETPLLESQQPTTSSSAAKLHPLRHA